MNQLGHLKDSSPLKQLYDEARLPVKIRRSLNFIILGNIMGSAHGVICGGGTTAMIGLATELGANDFMFGVLAAIPQLAALMQLPFSVLVNRTHARKKYMLTFGLLSRALWLIFGLIPYMLPMTSSVMQLWIMIFLIGISSCGGAMINVCWFPWLSDLTPIGIRGRFLSIRESILAACNVLIGLIVAYALDVLPTNVRYIVIFLIGGATGILDMVCFGFCEEVYSAPPQKQHLFSAIGQVLKNKPFMKLTIMWTAWCFAANMSGVYLTPYSMNEMGLNFMQIMIFSTIACSIVSIFVMPCWGRMLDRFGSRNVMLISCAVASLTPLFYLFSSPGNIWPTLLHNTVGAMFWCGANLTCSNMQLSCSPDATRPTHIALFSCVTSMAGSMLGSLTGGALLEAWNSSGMFTGAFDRYQALFVLSVIIRMSSSLLLVAHFAPDNEARPRDMLRYMVRSVLAPLQIGQSK